MSTQLTKIEYYNARQIGETLYQLGFKNEAYLRAVDVQFGETETQEDVKLRGVFELPVETRLVRKINFTYLVPDKLRTALEAIPLHEFCSITAQGATYDAVQRCSVSSEYLEGGVNMHRVTVTVPYDVTVSREGNANETATIL